MNIKTYICYFGQTITEEKLYNVETDLNGFVQVSSCACKNVPWLDKKWHK